MLFWKTRERIVPSTSTEMVWYKKKEGMTQQRLCNVLLMTFRGVEAV